MKKTGDANALLKKHKLPLVLRVIRWSFPKVELVAPMMARAWFVRLFFSPPRYPIPLMEREVLQQSEKFFVQAGGVPVPCYRWGSKGPIIMFVHGWAGRASQFRLFIPALAAMGYQVIAFDAPAHGNAPGKRTNIFEFKDAMIAIEQHGYEIKAIIAHSIGGAAAMLSLRAGLQTKILITIATPSIGDEIISEFSRRIHASPKAQLGLRDHIYQKFNCTFDELTAAHQVKQIARRLQWLIIHDEQDKEASVKNAAHLQAAYPSAQVNITNGLGHVKILRDDNVIQGCIHFITESLKTRDNVFEQVSN